ncbi:hypothetical protein NVP1170O_138 [Vibrio phage 1.170.O._10N.261.52.C3]|nr:hypothetical protein NVP1170O_138 [Vibrio phage 1.170.O._10N.261.52.C3]
MTKINTVLGFYTEESTRDGFNYEESIEECDIYLDNQLNCTVLKIGNMVITDISQLESLIAHYKHVKKFSEEV